MLVLSDELPPGSGDAIPADVEEVLDPDEHELALLALVVDELVLAGAAHQARLGVGQGREDQSFPDSF